MKKKIRIATSNAVYGIRGNLYFRTHDNGEPRDYLEDAAVADDLLGLEDSPFREVDDNGDVIPNEKDLLAQQDVSDDAAARTVITESGAKKAAEEAAKSDEPAPAKATGTVNLSISAKSAAKKTAAAKKTTAKKAATQAAAPEEAPQEPPVAVVDDTTEGAVEV